MSQQRLLDFDAAPAVREREDRTIQERRKPLTNAERFALVMERSPEIYERFVAYAREWRAAGHTRASADSILHRVRWSTGLECRDGSNYKINNNLSAFFARQLLKDYPHEFGRDFFETRAQRSQ